MPQQAGRFLFVGGGARVELIEHRADGQPREGDAEVLADGPTLHQRRGLLGRLEEELIGLPRIGDRNAVG